MKEERKEDRELDVVFWGERERERESRGRRRRRRERVKKDDWGSDEGERKRGGFKTSAYVGALLPVCMY